ncbi:MAG: D-alanyl-lipoteichoic acid biosynthesis protein DltD, partial [Anaerovoracaceae bacterium]
SIDKYKLYLKSENLYSKAGAKDVFEAVLDKNTILLLGSSEFNYDKTLDMNYFPTEFFNQGGYETNIAILGAGGTQSLYHAITVAALSEDLQSKKVALIVSPQWFTEEGVAKDAFAGNFNGDTYLAAMENKTLPKELKEKIAERTETLLEGMDEKALEQVKENNSVSVEETKNLVKKISIAIQSDFMTLKAKRDVAKKIPEEAKTFKIEKKPAGEPDFSAMLADAEATGKEKTSNNTFGIHNSYFEQYVKADLAESRGISAYSTCPPSKEREDLQLFLDVCKATGVEPLLIGVPFSGIWYDYISFPKAEREKQYQVIREVAAENKVQLADLYGHEGEMYFLSDVMHIGWKGWVYIDESLYRFAKKN